MNNRKNAPKSLSDFARVESGGLIVPKHMANEIGLGCDKCDDHELIPIALGQDALSKFTSAFLKKHGDHGRIDTLERHDGRLFVTGQLAKKAVLV